MLPGSATSLGEGVFEDCTKLKSAKLSAGLAGVPDSAFAGCAALKCITIPAKVTHIGDHALSSCGLASTEIPEKVTAVGDFAFYECLSLSNVTILGNNATFGEGALHHLVPASNKPLPNLKIRAIYGSKTASKLKSAGFACTLIADPVLSASSVKGKITITGSTVYTGKALSFTANVT